MLSPKNEYFGIAYPVELIRSINSDSEPHVQVTESRKEALDICKRFKGSRFKTFLAREDALKFSQHGQDSQDSSQANAAALSGEKPSQFRGPTPQDIVKLRKAAEAGNVIFFLYTVWSNPRYLISSGDTPVTSGGQKYNMLHFVCKANQTEVGRELLKVITDLDFLKLYYPDDTESYLEEKRDRYLDLYLNTPDKTLQETPLHVASKFGCLECVELLCLYMQMDTKKVNKDGKTAFDIVCDRADKPQDVRETMRKLLSDRYFIPVMISDKVDQRVIGELWSPDVTVEESDAPSFRPLASRTPTRAEGFQGFSPSRNSGTSSWIPGPQTPTRLPPGPGSPFTSPLAQRVVAFAGPADRETAELIHKKWKTPPRIAATPGRNNGLGAFATPPRKASAAETILSRESIVLPSPMRHDEVRHFNTPQRTLDSIRRPRTSSCTVGSDEPDSNGMSRFRALSEIRLKDPERGMQDFGLELCREKGVPFVEYWPFLNEFVNLRSDDGLEKLDRFFKNKTAEMSRQNLDIKKLSDMLETVAISRRGNELGSSPTLKRNIPLPPVAEALVPPRDENDNAKSPVSDICERLQQMSLQTPDVKNGEMVLACDTPSEHGDGAKGSISSSCCDLSESLRGGVGALDTIGNMHTGLKVEPGRFREDLTPEKNQGLSGLLRYHITNGNVPDRAARRLFEDFHQQMEDDDSEDEVFETPDSSPDSGRTPEEAPDVYIEGSQPTKTDRDVLKVLHGTKVDPKRFPYVFVWQHCASQIMSADPVRFSSPMLRRPPAESGPSSPLSEPVNGLRLASRRLPTSPLVIRGVAPLKK